MHGQYANLSGGETVIHLVRKPPDKSSMNAVANVGEKSRILEPELVVYPLTASLCRSNHRWVCLLAHLMTALRPRRFTLRAGPIYCLIVRCDICHRF